MPAETHQQGRIADPANVAEFLAVLLDSDGRGLEGSVLDVRLADCGVTVDDIDWLWETVCEEFSERTMSPELDPGELIPAMTIAETAAVVARALAAAPLAES